MGGIAGSSTSAVRARPGMSAQCYPDCHSVRHSLALCSKIVATPGCPSNDGGALRVIEVEAWALRVIDRVQRGVPIEDSRVELKADWPEDSNKAARRIAGHCNARADDRVLWLIGVSEVSGVVGANSNDMATWWPQVKSEFDGQAPYIRDVHLTLSTGVIVALLFELTRPRSWCVMLSMV
jgi:hypothetical protein